MSGVRKGNFRFPERLDFENLPDFWTGHDVRQSSKTTDQVSRFMGSKCKYISIFATHHITNFTLNHIFEKSWRQLLARFIRFPVHFELRGIHVEIFLPYFFIHSMNSILSFHKKNITRLGNDLSTCRCYFHTYAVLILKKLKQVFNKTPNLEP